MMVQALQSYVNLVNSLSKASRERTRASAHDLLSQAGLEDVASDAGERFSKLVEELVNASRANRELVESLVSAEVTRVVRGLGFVRSDDLDELREEIAELRHQLDRHRRASDSTDAPRTPAGNAPGRAAASSATDGGTVGESRPGAAPSTGSTPAERGKSSRRKGTRASGSAEGTPPGVSPDSAVAGSGTAATASQASSKPTAGQAAAAGRSSASRGTPRGTAPGAAPTGSEDAEASPTDSDASGADEQMSPVVGGADAGA